MAWGIGRSRIGHAGSTPTFSARASLLPQSGHGIIVLANVNSGPFFDGTAAVMDGIVSILGGDRARPSRPDEILLKVGILLLMLAGIGRMLAAFRRWMRRGRPRTLDGSRRVVQPLLVEIVAAIIVLLAIPRWLGVPLRTILEYFPDLGIAMVVGVFTGLCGALLRSLVVASETRQAAEPVA
jgi:hypothetical protein